MAECKTSCPNFACFCYKNAWHWYALSATLPFAAKGLDFVLHLVTANVTAAQ